MKYTLIFFIGFLLSCNSEHRNQSIDGLWVIDPNSNFSDYMEFAIIKDTIHFNLPSIFYRHKLILKKDSISLFGGNKLFKIRPHKITMVYNDTNVVDFVRPSIQQLEIGLYTRRVIYRIDKSDSTPSEKTVAKTKFLEEAYMPCD